MLSQFHPSSSYDYEFRPKYREYQFEFIPLLEATPPLVATTASEERDSTVSPPECLEKFPRSMCPAECKVCGGQATGYHYEVPSCNGCKTFFRRTVLSKKTFTCKRDGVCESDLTKKKQHWCRACRFKRCVNAGMNPLAISSQDNPGDNEVVKEIMRKRSAEACSTSYDSDVAIPEPVLKPQELQLDKLIDGLLYLEIKKELFRKCKYNPDPRQLPPLEELIKSSCQMDLGDRLGPMPDWPLAPLPPASDEQRALWRKQGFMFRPNEGNRKNWLVFDLLTTVEYAKTFPFFHRLSEPDRMILLKSVGLICYNLTQAFFSFENKSDLIMHPDGTNLMTPPKDAPRYQMIYNLKKKLLAPLIRDRLNKKEYVLLKALMLCNASISDLSLEGKEVLEQERVYLNKALLHLSLSERGKDGPARYASNISLVQTVEHLTKLQKDVNLLVRITSQNTIFTGLVADMYEC